MRPAATAVLLLLLGAGMARADDGAPRPAGLEDLQVRWLADPTDLDLGLRLQDALSAEGLDAQAEQLFRRTASQNKGEAALRFLAGRARGDGRGLQMMREAWARELGRPARESRGLLSASIAMAVAEVAAGDGPRAAAAAERVVALRGGADDWVYLAWIRRRLLGRADLAREAYEAALTKREDHPGARAALIGLLLDAGEHATALQEARRGVELCAQSAAAHVRLALAQRASGAGEVAAVSCGHAQRLAAGDARALAAVASAWAELGRSGEARQAFEQALALDPKQGDALAGAGLLAMERGDLREARKLLSAAGRARPRSARVAFLQGVCAQRLGLHSSAISSLRRATDLDPGRVEYVAALGMAHLEKGSLASAVMMLERALEMTPGDASLHLQLGMAHYKRRTWKPAQEAFLRAARAAPQDPRPYFYLAMIHGDKLGRPREALVDLERYEALGGRDPAALSWRKRLLDELGDR